MSELKCFSKSAVRRKEVINLGLLKKRKFAKTVVVDTKVECAGLDETLHKLERLQELLKEANSLADELASKEINVVISM